MNSKKYLIGFCIALAIVLLICIVIGITGRGQSANGPDTEETLVTEEIITEETEFTELEEVIQTVSVKMTASSFEKDLKIKILDESDSLIAGVDFVIVVAKEDGSESKEYNDHDMDGIIYISGIEPGKYKVQLQEKEGYIIAENPISATVKEQIVYEKVEIKDEIKDESQIDASKEDTATKEEVVENVKKDTLSLIKSTVTTEEVKKEFVDISNFADAFVSEEKITEIIQKTQVNEIGEVVVVAATEASLPKSATLFTAGKDTSKVVEIALELQDEAELIKDITWFIDGVDVNESSDVIDIAVAEDKKSATLTMKSAGQVKVSVVLTYEETQTEPGVEVMSEMEDSEENQDETTLATKELVCDVLVCGQTDGETALKDTNGNKLYLDNEAKTVATIKDYETAEMFYANPKYTGWQTLDGKVYYFKEDNTYATGKQVIGGVDYEFDRTGYLVTKRQSIGIDVSKWQGEIDWKAVADSGIEFAIIRCGYRGSSSGTLVEDPYYRQNIKGAVENGIKVGVYLYSQAITKAEAIEEASMALELVKGYHLQLPIYIDTEGSGGRGDNVSKEDRTEFIKAFCETIKTAGYNAGVYSGRYWFTNHVNASELEQYHIWVAQYADKCTYTGRYDIWQHTSSGTVPGINGKVDMNIAYRVYY